MPTKKRLLGDEGEKLAEAYLLDKGFILIERNFLVRQGEIDLIVRSPEGEIVFVEVRTRKSLNYGSPFESISPAKARHLIAAAYTYLKKQGMEQSDFRIDLISVVFPGPQIEHLENAIEQW